LHDLCSFFPIKIFLPDDFRKTVYEANIIGALNNRTKRKQKSKFIIFGVCKLLCHSIVHRILVCQAICEKRCCVLLRQLQLYTILAVLLLATHIAEGLVDPKVLETFLVSAFQYPRTCRLRRYQIESRLWQLPLPTSFKTSFLIHKIRLKLAKHDQNSPKKFEYLTILATIYELKLRFEKSWLRELP
jgi:hypothetical protein